MYFDTGPHTNLTRGASIVMIGPNPPPLDPFHPVNEESKVLVSSTFGNPESDKEDEKEEKNAADLSKDMG